MMKRPYELRRTNRTRKGTRFSFDFLVSFKVDFTDKVCELKSLLGKALWGQVGLKVRFIHQTGLKKYFIRRVRDGFARRYNGPSYKNNQFATKMANALKLYSGDLEVNRIKQDAEGRKLLKKLGYCVYDMKAAIADFQIDNGKIAIDGILGPETLTSIQEAAAARAVPRKVGIVSVNTGVAIFLVGGIFTKDFTASGVSGIKWGVLLAVCLLSVAVLRHRNSLKYLFSKGRKT